MFVSRMENPFKKGKNSFGYANQSYSGVLDYTKVNDLHNKMVSNSIDEASPDHIEKEVTNHSINTSLLRRTGSQGNKSSINIIPLISVDERYQYFPECEEFLCVFKEESFSPNKSQNTNSGTKNEKSCDYDSDRNISQSSAPGPYSYVRPTSKRNVSQTCLPSSLKFSSRGLPTQNTNFTPLMFRRAISLRGHSIKQNVETTKKIKNGTGNGTFRTLLRRSNSEKSHANVTPKSEEGLSFFSRHSPLMNSFKRLGSHSPDSSSSSSKGKSRTDSEDTYTEDLNSPLRNCSLEAVNITDLVMNNVCNKKLLFQSSEAFANDLTFFSKNLEEYILSLSEFLSIYDKMKIISPDKIRQHFDLPLSVVKSIFSLQCEINRTVKEARGDLKKIAKQFLNDQFVSYQQYMIMSPSIFSDFHHYKDHFELNFPIFKSLILTPSSKLNFYIQTLSSFLKFASQSERMELNRAIAYLEDLKWNANTEMTIKIVKDSPIDLHLGGKILNVGDLIYANGPLPKRSYYVIAFENMLVITISKVSYCVYVTHFRPEQIISVNGERNLELIVTTASCTQGIREVHKFKSTDKTLDKWFTLIDEWIVDKTASFEIISESHNCSSKFIEGKTFPLSLWQVFPFLKKSFSKEIFFPAEHKIKDARQLCTLLVDKETEYVEKLNNIFNPETLPPPPELKDFLLRFLNLHEVYFLPELKEAIRKNYETVIDIYMNYLQKFHTYKSYLIKRSICTAHMPDGFRAQYYIVPIQQFSFYIEWSKELGLIERYKDASAFAIDTLLSSINDAKVMLLHEAIPNCCLDFYRTGELKKGTQMTIKVRPRQKGLRDGIYMVVLFEKVLLILKTIYPTYEIVFDLWLYQTNFGPRPGDSNSFKLEYRQGRSKTHINFEFKTRNSESRQEFVNLLTEELHSQAEQIKQCSALTNVS